MNNESLNGCEQLSGALARPNDLTCQVCEKLCENEERFFRHIHKYHPDYWRVFAGGRPLTDYIQPPPTSPSSSSSTAVSRRFAVRRDRRFTCTVCGKTFTQVSHDKDDDDGDDVSK